MHQPFPSSSALGPLNASGPLRVGTSVAFLGWLHCTPVQALLGDTHWSFRWLALFLGDPGQAFRHHNKLHQAYKIRALMHFVLFKDRAELLTS